MQTQEPFRQTATQEALDRNPLRFARLMDVQGAFPFGKSPPRPRSNATADESREARESREGSEENPRQNAMPSYLSLLDDEPAAGRVRLRPDVDYGTYDAEFAAMIARKSKGTKIQFPDLYRTKA